MKKLHIKFIYNIIDTKNHSVHIVSYTILLALRNTPYKNYIDTNKKPPHTKYSWGML